MISQKLTFTISIILAITLGATGIVSTVTAEKPHFSGTPTIVMNSDLSITANFKATALGKKTTDVYLSSNASTQLGCVNPGGNSPPSETKKTDFEQKQNQTLKLKPDNGKIKGTISLHMPTLPSALEICPNKNWSVDLLSLVYQDVVLHIQRKNTDILTYDFGNVTQNPTAIIR